MKSFYWLLGAAALLDLIIMPWVWGGNFYIKFVLALLPFAFAFFSKRDTNIIFMAALIYLRIASSYNLGLIFIALMAMAVFESRFLIIFFHKTVWQSLIFSAAGIILFYLVLVGGYSLLMPGNVFLDWRFTETILATTCFSAVLNFLLIRIYKHAL